MVRRDGREQTLRVTPEPRTSTRSATSASVPDVQPADCPLMPGEPAERAGLPRRRHRSSSSTASRGRPARAAESDQEQPAQAASRSRSASAQARRDVTVHAASCETAKAGSASRSGPTKSGSSRRRCRRRCAQLGEEPRVVDADLQDLRGLVQGRDVPQAADGAGGHRAALGRRGATWAGFRSSR